MPTDRPRMRDVAARAGVSSMTVSLALRNHPSLPESTRQRIQHLAEEMGYRPNPLVSAFVASRRAGQKGRRQLPLAFLTSLSSRNCWRKNPTYLGYFKGARTRAEQFGCQLNHVWYDRQSVTPEKMSDILFERGIHGILIAPIEEPGGSLWLDWSRFACVALGYSMSQPPIHRACSHQFHTMLSAMRHLDELGYQRIGLATDFLHDKSDNQNWVAPYLYYTQQVMKTTPLPILADGAWGEHSFLSWCQQNRPDVVVTTRIDAYHWLVRSGLRVPEKMGVLLLDRWEGARDISCVDQNSAQVGAAAVDLLIGQLYQNERGIPTNPKAVLVEGALHCGKTLVPQNQKLLA